MPIPTTLADALSGYLASAPDALPTLRAWLAAQSPHAAHPVDHIQWLPLHRLRANDYNPNHVAPTELSLLLTSIQHDGYTQPVVVIFDPAQDAYVIVDGFHRYHVLQVTPALQDSTLGCLPCVVLDKPAGERMASTVRHNRARGKHSVAGMSNLIYRMLDSGMSDADVCNALGMEPDELLRLKHLTGYSSLFANRDYSQSWVVREQIAIALAHDADPDGGPRIPPSEELPHGTP